MYLSKIGISKLKLLLLIFSLAVIVLAAYFSFEIIQARQETARVISDLKNPDFLKLDLGDFTHEQIDILLKVEDPGFYEHCGIDFSTPGAGLTTITQALVKLYYFDDFKPGMSKIKQSLIAVFALDRQVAKDDQLRLLINKVYLGHVSGRPVRGFEEASRVYFGKPFKEISRDEYIALVSMIIAPNTVNILNQPEANAERVRRIKRLIAGECAPDGWLDVWLEGCK